MGDDAAVGLVLVEGAEADDERRVGVGGAVTPAVLAMLPAGWDVSALGASQGA